MINASLGAHYSGQFVRTSIGLFWRTLLGLPLPHAAEKLKTELEKMFGGRAVLVYKGRDAIELALRAYGITNQSDTVLTQAFSCYAIEEAIVRAGAAPHYVDLGDGQLNLTAATLESAYKKAKNTKAVIVQNTLGHPAEMTAIKAWCQKHSLLLIEDLAQSFGAMSSGQLLGTFGDAVILSFGRDKVIDAASGGAVVFRTQPSELPSEIPTTPRSVVLNDLAYPFYTWLIRATYDVLVGKILHKLLTLIGIMGNPTQAQTNSITALPESFAHLALYQLAHAETNHRIRQITAALYLEELVTTPLRLLTTQSDLSNGSLLRVAATTNDPKTLLSFLKAYNIHLTDRWYRSPVDCGTLKCETAYEERSSPNAEKLAQTIINLPTHEKLSVNDAEKIITIIKKFFENKK